MGVVQRIIIVIYGINLTQIWYFHFSLILDNTSVVRFQIYTFLQIRLSLCPLDQKDEGQNQKYTLHIFPRVICTLGSLLKHEVCEHLKKDEMHLNNSEARLIKKMQKVSKVVTAASSISSKKMETT